jgi:serine/threonine protein kinase
MIEIGKQLGAGCFGRVLKGQAEGIIPGEELKTETVAIKMVRSYADLSALASLVSELKILIHLGSHLNIVNLLGACTDVANGLNFNCLIRFILNQFSSVFFERRFPRYRRVLPFRQSAQPPAGQSTMLHGPSQ